jgi:4-carboxymuconolactone decarboxylase
MKLIAATTISLFLLALASAQTTQMSSSSPQDQQKIKITRNGTLTSQQGPAENFTGSVSVQYLVQTKSPARTSSALVTFQPGARTAWHTHPLGQVLIVTRGSGRVQRWGDAVDEIRQGDVVWIPPGQKHWHGAAPNSSMSHIAIVEALDGKSVDWMEKVSEEQYSAQVALKLPPRIRLATGHRKKRLVILRRSWQSSLTTCFMAMFGNVRSYQSVTAVS